MGKPKAKDISKALRRVLSKDVTQAQKLSVVRGKVLKKLSKKHSGVDELKLAGLIAEILASNSEFNFDGKRVSLGQTAGTVGAGQQDLQDQQQQSQKHRRCLNNHEQRRHDEKADKRRTRSDKQVQQHVPAVQPAPQAHQQHPVQQQLPRSKQDHLHISEQAAEQAVEHKRRRRRVKQQDEAAAEQREFKKARKKQQQNSADTIAAVGPAADATGVQQRESTKALKPVGHHQHSVTEEAQEAETEHRSAQGNPPAAAAAAPMHKERKHKKEQQKEKRKHNKEKKQAAAGEQQRDEANGLAHLGDTAATAGMQRQQQHKLRFSHPSEPHQQGVPAAAPQTAAAEQIQKQKHKREASGKRKQQQDSELAADTKHPDTADAVAGLLLLQQDVEKTARHTLQPAAAAQPRSSEGRQHQQQRSNLTELINKALQHVPKQQQQQQKVAKSWQPRQKQTTQQQDMQRDAEPQQQQQNAKPRQPRQKQTQQQDAAPQQQQQQAAAVRPKHGASRHTQLNADTMSAAVAAAGLVDDGPAWHRDGGDTWRADYNRTDVKHGRFNADEKATVDAAIREFAEQRGLPYGPGNCDWLVNRDRETQKRGALTAIAAALPNRTRKAVWQFVRANYVAVQYTEPFTPEDDQRLLALHQQLGPRWKEIGQHMGRRDQACRDRARELNYGQPKSTGRWSEDEVDALQSAVLSYKQAVAEQGGGLKTLSHSCLPSDHQPRAQAVMSLENIDWTWVAAEVKSRTAKQCAEKYYAKLAPSMLESGQWGKGDDKRLMLALAAAGKQEDYQLDWGSLVPGRTAEQCKRRWRLILKFLPADIRHDFAACVKEAANRVKTTEKAKQRAAAAAAAAVPAAGCGSSHQHEDALVKGHGDQQQQEQVKQGLSAAEAVELANTTVGTKRRKRKVQDKELEAEADE